MFRLSRLNAALLSILFAAIFLSAAWPMARRIGDYNTARQFRRFHTEPILFREARVPGFPALRFDDSTDPATGRFAVRLTVTDPPSPPAEPTVRYIQVKQPAGLNLPNLGIYEEWLRVLAINEVIRDDSGRQIPAPGSERIIVAVRRTPEGLNPESWGSVKRTEWLFDFYEIMRDGTVAFSTRRWPMLTHYEEAFQRRAALPGADPGLKTLAAIAPLEERSVEYFAALHVIPKLNVPKYKFTDTAFNPRILGWTLPVCMLSGLGFCFAFFFAVAPRRQFP